ncbi:MAG: hypothetical protein KDK99_15025 [Verrucomicrobiales bacterium]|nr:hypothetical protein [Verrucomicrobiales bacterium]
MTRSRLPHLLAAAIATATLSQCVAPSGNPGTSSSSPLFGGRMPEIINVSAYDPKERHRAGRSYSEHDVSALRANGALGLIARAGKGGDLDEKCASFLAAADRAGMMVGVYYRVQRHVSITRQADQFVARVRSLAASRSWQSPALLLCGDYDGDLSPSQILQFMDRVEAATGVVPVAYLENTQDLKLALGNASPQQKARLRRAPYWVALYSHDGGAGPVFPAPGDPHGLLGQYRVWGNWAMWQYGGVAWENGRSRPKVYHHGRWPFPPYFGDLDRPVERNVFNGSPATLSAFWQHHGLSLRR